MRIGRHRPAHARLGLRTGDEQAFVGAGSVVIGDVPAHALVVGNPARRIGWMCACEEKLDQKLACTCGRRYRLIDATAGLQLEGATRR